MFFAPFAGYAVSQAPLDLPGRYTFDPHWRQNQAFTGVSSYNSYLIIFGT